MDNAKTKKIKPMHALAYFLLVIGLICLVVGGILGIRIFRRIEHIRPPMPRETNISLIQDWMTITYISRTYGVPSQVIFEKLNLDSQKYRRSSLKQVAGDLSTPSASLIDSVKGVINDFQLAHQTPPPPN